MDNVFRRAILDNRSFLNALSAYLLLSKPRQKPSATEMGGEP